MGKKRGNGEGSIMKLDNGSWMGKIMIGRKPDGTANRKSIYGKTRKEVSDKLIALANDVNSGSYIEPSKLSLGDWLNNWLKQYKSINLKPKTYDTYETQANYNIIPAIGDIALKDLKTDDIQRYYNSKFNSGKGLSSATIRKHHNILSGALNQAVESGFIQKNPAKGAELPTLKQKEIKVFTLDEQMLFFQVAKDFSLLNAFIVNVDTGLRMGELLALTWDDIDFENELVNVNKNIIFVKDREGKTGNENMLIVQDSPKTKASTRKVPLTQRSLSLLESLRQTQQKKSDIIFCSNKGTYVSPRNYERAFLRVVEKAGIEKCNAHTLRHTYATRLFECGVDAKVVSEFLGHSKVSHTLDIYTHVLPNVKKRAVQVLDNLYSNVQPITTQFTTQPE